MADPTFPEATKENLWSTYQELKRPIDAEYRAQIAGPQKMKTQRLADVQREYDQKMSLAKTDYYQAQRRLKETSYALKTWRDASFRAAEQEYRNAQQPASARRKSRMKPLDEWFQEQRDRLWKTPEPSDHQDGQA